MIRFSCYTKTKFEINFSFQCISQDIATLIDENYPVGNYVFKVNNRDTILRIEICLKLTLVSMFLLSTLNIFHFLLFLLLTLGRVMQQLAQKKFMQAKLTQRMLFTNILANTQIDKKKRFHEQ